MKRMRLAAAWVILVAAWRVLDITPDGSSGGSQALLRSVVAVSSREERLGAARAPTVLWMVTPSVIWKREASALGSVANAAYERVVEPLGRAARGAF